MLANRGIRGKVSTSELFSNTINTYLDRDKMNLLRKIKDEKKSYHTQRATQRMVGKLC